MMCILKEAINEPILNLLLQAHKAYDPKTTAQKTAESLVVLVSLQEIRGSNPRSRHSRGQSPEKCHQTLHLVPTKICSTSVDVSRRS